MIWQEKRGKLPRSHCRNLPFFLTEFFNFLWSHGEKPSFLPSISLAVKAPSSTVDRTEQEENPFAIMHARRGRGRFSTSSSSSPCQQIQCPVAAAAAQETLVMSTCDVMAKRPPPRRQRIFPPPSRSSAESIGLDGRTFFGAMRNIFFRRKRNQCNQGEEGEDLSSEALSRQVCTEEEEESAEAFSLPPSPSPLAPPCIRGRKQLHRRRRKEEEEEGDTSSSSR